MKKIGLVILTLIIGGLIITGCSNTAKSDDPSVKLDNKVEYGNQGKEENKEQYEAALAEAKKVCQENGYNLESDSGEKSMNGDSESFKLIDKVIKEGGYKGNLKPGNQGYIYYVFKVSEKSNGNDIILGVVMVKDKVYGAYLDYLFKNKPSEYRSIKDTKDIDRL